MIHLKRFMALIIDAIIVLSIYIATTQTLEVNSFVAIVNAALFEGLFICFITPGQTLGKKVMGLEVVLMDSEEINRMQKTTTLLARQLIKWMLLINVGHQVIICQVLFYLITKEHFTIIELFVRTRVVDKVVNKVGEENENSVLNTPLAS